MKKTHSYGWLWWLIINHNHNHMQLCSVNGPFEIIRAYIYVLYVFDTQMRNLFQW